MQSFPEKYFADEVPKAEPKPLPTLAEQLDTWLSSVRVATSTRKGYVSCANFWKRAPCEIKDDEYTGRLIGSVIPP